MQGRDDLVEHHRYDHELGHRLTVLVSLDAHPQKVAIHVPSSSPVGLWVSRALPRAMLPELMWYAEAIIGHAYITTKTAG